MINPGRSRDRFFAEARISVGGERREWEMATRREGLSPIMFVVNKGGAARAVRTVLTVAAVGALPAFAAGCMSKNDDVNLATYVEQTDPADQLYNQGLANLNAGRLKEASRKFDSVDRQHPYSEYARKSMVMAAFTNYRQGNYDDSINSAKRYLALYPSTPDAAYAQYIIGLCYFRQIKDVT